MRAPGIAVLFVLALSGAVQAAEFRSAVGPATILYDGPSLKARPVVVVGRDYPLEVIVSVEGWHKVRDATGELAWVERRAVAERRSVMVRVPVAEVRSGPDPSAPVVFQAEQGVLLELADAGASPPPPGWLSVRHRDGQSGFIRLQNVWGV